MADITDLSGMNKAQRDFVIRHLGMPRGHDYGWIRELYRTAFDSDIPGEFVAKIEVSYPNRIAKARKDFAQSYKEHKLYQKAYILDVLDWAIETGKEEKPYGSFEVPIKDPDSGEIRKERIVMSRNDPKSVLGAAKLAIEIIHEDERRDAKPKEDEEDRDELAGLSVVRTN